MRETAPGSIVVLNGAPRSGKSSIASAVHATFEGLWLNLGVDVFARHVTPEAYQPGIGLRPGEPAHPVAYLVPLLYAALYESIAAHSRLGLNVVVDVGHHDARVLADCARRLDDLPALLVGVRCPIEVIMERRNTGQPGREGMYARGTPDDPIPEPVRRWQDAVHRHGVYDLEVDTSLLSPGECAALIRRRLASAEPGAAFPRLAGRNT